MRHRVYGKHLGRNKDERENLFKGLVRALLTHGTIQTSEAKAKAIKGLVDKVINLAKNKNTQRLLQTYLANKDLQERLVKEIVPKLGNRNSGYTRVVRLGTRYGDQTSMVRMSLIGSEELKPVVRESRIKQKELSKKPEEAKRKSKASPRNSVKTKTVQTKKRSKKA